MNHENINSRETQVIACKLVAGVYALEVSRFTGEKWLTASMEARKTPKGKWATYVQGEWYETVATLKAARKLAASMVAPVYIGSLAAMNK